jgi:D-tyrosyl-tRNA(Tyr) deacylase
LVILAAKSSRRKANFIRAIMVMTFVQMPREKYSAFVFTEIVVVYRHPASSKRDVRVVTIRGVRGAVDAVGGARRAQSTRT